MREIKTIKGTKLTRDKNYKIGKRVGNDIYFHKDYINEFNFTNEIRKKIALIPINYNFNIIRFNLKNRDASFINSPNFNTSFHPIISHSFKISGDNQILSNKPRKSGSNPTIHHHRWMFVKDNYTGFNIEQDFKWSKLWVRTPNLISNRYGYLAHWNKISLPKIFEFYQVKSIEKLLKRN